MVTLYTYDTLDNLTCVEQHGTATGQTGCSHGANGDAASAWRIRRFTYDSLSRLVTAKNPESGTISYTYDSDGNVLTKYDARGITTTMTYDQLHRVLTKTYSDGTPTATYIYDVAATDGPGSSGNPKGRLVEVKNSNAKGVDSYDSRGRIAAQWQCTPLNCGSSWFNLTYAYNFAGGLISESTPMGFTLTPSYDPAARLKQLTSSWSDAQHPATLLSVDQSVGYTPAGAFAKLTYGNGLVELNAYNNRLQPTQMRTYNPANNNADVLNLTYGFTNSAGANNGNVVTFNSTATQVFMRTYTYDELNRLSTMSSPADASGCYGLSWTYDAWGNRLSQTPTSGGCFSPNHGVWLNNRILDTGYSHDSAGNMTSDGIHAYAFDAENRITMVDGGGATYLYDVDGKRIRKTTGGVTTDYVYNAFGNLIGEIQGATWTREYVNVGTKVVAQYNGALGTSGATTAFLHKDYLGSTRVVTALNTAVSDSMDYLPYGELLSGGSSSTNKFTGKERDAESGLDNFGARYYGSALGRFVAVDPTRSSMELIDPQTLNRYAYANNNPLVFVDHNGKWSTSIHDAIIEKAFPGLSEHQRDILKGRSASMDHDQSGKGAYKHAMMGLRDKTKAAAKEKTADFLVKREAAAQIANFDPHTCTTCQASLITDKSMGIAGDAIHTAADSTSPAHTDANGDPKLWIGPLQAIDPSNVAGSIAAYAGFVEAHNSQEATISPEQMDAAVAAVQAEFQSIYGSQLATQAESKPVTATQDDKKKDGAKS